MTTKNEMLKEVKEIFQTAWKIRDGQKVPETEDIQLGNDAVLLDGTVLYADLAESTSLVNEFKNWFAAEVYKSYLSIVCRIIKNNGGEITAFDGDRVMAVFIGDYRNTSSAKCALQINWAVKNIINKTIKEVFSNTSYEVKQAVGIDTCKLFIARTGIRKYNELVWVGRAANYAAKLCSLRDGSYASYITSEVFDKLRDDVKYGGNNRQLMWEKIMWNEKGIAVYRSSWSWSID